MCVPSRQRCLSEMESRGACGVARPTATDYQRDVGFFLFFKGSCSEWFQKNHFKKGRETWKPTSSRKYLKTKQKTPISSVVLVFKKSITFHELTVHFLNLDLNLDSTVQGHIFFDQYYYSWYYGVDLVYLSDTDVHYGLKTPSETMVPSVVFWHFWRRKSSAAYCKLGFL